MEIEFNAEAPKAYYVCYHKIPSFALFRKAFSRSQLWIEVLPHKVDIPFDAFDAFDSPQELVVLSHNGTMYNNGLQCIFIEHPDQITSHSCKTKQCVSEGQDTAFNHSDNGNYSCLKCGKSDVVLQCSGCNVWYPFFFFSFDLFCFLAFFSLVALPLPFFVYI